MNADLRVKPRPRSVQLFRGHYTSRGWIGRPSKDRLAIASAFVAKAVYGFALTRQLLDALASYAQLRRICGWKEPWQVPHESTFSRAFDEFARMELPQFVHETLIRETQKDWLIGHIARDSTAIEARERYPEAPATRPAFVCRRVWPGPLRPCPRRRRFGWQAQPSAAVM
jgi:hypothetical protein